VLEKYLWIAGGEFLQLDSISESAQI